MKPVKAKLFAQRAAETQKGQALQRLPLLKTIRNTGSIRRPDLDHIRQKMLQQVLDAVLERCG